MSFEIINVFVEISSKIIIATIAFLGLREWKYQFKYKENYGIAKQLYKQTLQIKNEIEYIRNPNYTTDEAL